MRRALSAAMLAFAMTISAAGIARADVPPWPPEPPQPPDPAPTSFEQGEAVGRAIGFACGLGCCLAMPVITGLVVFAISRRKKPGAS